MTSEPLGDFESFVVSARFMEGMQGTDCLLLILQMALAVIGVCRWPMRKSTMPYLVMPWDDQWPKGER